jgi:hypothetical protein
MMARELRITVILRLPEDTLAAAALMAKFQTPTDRFRNDVMKIAETAQFTIANVKLKPRQPQLALEHAETE